MWLKGKTPIQPMIFHDWLYSSLIVDEIFAPSCKLSLTPSDLLRRVKVAKGWSHHGPNGYRSGPQYEHAGLQCTLYSGKSHDTGHVRTLKRKSSSPIPGHVASCLAHDMGLWVGHLVPTSACFEKHLIPHNSHDIGVGYMMSFATVWTRAAYAATCSNRISWHRSICS